MKKQDFIEMMQRTSAPLKTMVGMIPDDKLDWKPGEGFMDMGQLLKHLTENWMIVEMMVKNEFPFKDEKEMGDSMKLENLKRCNKEECLAAMEKDLAAGIELVENGVSDDEFANKVITAPWGFKGEVWKAVGMANDHLNNHKMQLHIYLKLLGQPVHTGTLYGM